MRVPFMKLRAEWRKTRLDIEAPGAGDSKEPLPTPGLKKQGKEGLLQRPERATGEAGRGPHLEMWPSAETCIHFQPVGQQGGSHLFKYLVLSFFLLGHLCFCLPFAKPNQKPESGSCKDLSSLQVSFSGHRAGWRGDVYWGQEWPGGEWVTLLPTFV